MTQIVASLYQQSNKQAGMYNITKSSSYINQVNHPSSRHIKINNIKTYKSPNRHINVNKKSCISHQIRYIKSFQNPATIRSHITKHGYCPH